MVSTSGFFLSRILSYSFISEFFVSLFWCHDTSGVESMIDIPIHLSMRMFEETVEAETPPSSASPQSGCRTGDGKTPCACGCIFSRDRTISGCGVALYERVQVWSSPRCQT